MNNAKACLNAAIIYEHNFDSILQYNAPKMTMDTDTITNILGGSNAFIILNISLLTEQLSVHTFDLSNTWLIRKRTNLFDFGSDILRSYQVYLNSFDFSHICNGVFAFNNLINNHSILNINNYTHVNDIVLVVTHIIEYNYNLTVFTHNNYTSDNVSDFNFDSFISFVSVFDEAYSLSDFGVTVYCYAKLRNST